MLLRSSSRAGSTAWYAKPVGWYAVRYTVSKPIGLVNCSSYKEPGESRFEFGERTKQSYSVFPYTYTHYFVVPSRLLKPRCDVWESQTRKVISPVLLGGFRPFLAHWKGLEELYKVVVTDHQLVVESTS